MKLIEVSSVGSNPRAQNTLPCRSYSLTPGPLRLKIRIFVELIEAEVIREVKYSKSDKRMVNLQNGGVK